MAEFKGTITLNSSDDSCERSSIEPWIPLFSNMVWPLLLGAIVFCFRRQFASFLDRVISLLQKIVAIKYGDAEIVLQQETIADKEQQQKEEDKVPQRPDRVDFAKLEMKALGYLRTLDVLKNFQMRLDVGFNHRNRTSRIVVDAVFNNEGGDSFLLVEVKAFTDTDGLRRSLERIKEAVRQLRRPGGTVMRAITARAVFCVDSSIDVPLNIYHDIFVMKFDFKNEVATNEAELIKFISDSLQ